MKLGSEAMATNYSVIVNSPVITAAINKDSNKVYLSDPVVFTIRHLQVLVCPSMCVSLEMRLPCSFDIMGFFSLSILLSHTTYLYVYFMCLLNTTISSQFPMCSRNGGIPSQNKINVVKV